MSITTNKTTHFKTVFKLFYRYYTKSFIGPFFNLVFPILIFGILGSVMEYKTMFPGVVAMISVSIGVQTMPFAILELKKSVLLKRIGASPVKPSMFTFVLLVFYSIITILSIFWLMLWAMVITRNSDLFQSLSNIKHAMSFAFGVFINILLSISLGFAIASKVKTEMKAQAIGLILFFPIAFLSGQFLSPGIIASSGAMNWISRFIPFRYTTMMISESWLGDIVVPNFLDSSANIFAVHDYTIINEVDLTSQDIINFKTGKVLPHDILSKISKMSRTIIYSKFDHIVSFIYPYVSISFFMFYSIKKFSWSSGR